MNESELERTWQEQKPTRPSPEDVGQITHAMLSADRRFRRTIWWRDLREIGVAFICAVAIGFAGQTWLRWIAVASCIFVAAYILKSRVAVRDRPEASRLVDRLHEMLRETEKQIRLLRSVWWWYLLPCAIATIALMLDCAAAQGRLAGKFDLSYLTSFLVVMSVLYVAVYWLNQRTVRKCLEARRARLQQTLSELRGPS